MSYSRTQHSASGEGVEPTPSQPQVEHSFTEPLRHLQDMSFTSKRCSVGCVIVYTNDQTFNL